MHRTQRLDTSADMHVQVCFELSDTELATCDKGSCQPIMSQYIIFFYLNSTVYNGENVTKIVHIFVTDPGLTPISLNVFLYVSVSLSETEFLNSDFGAE